jgi:DNA primase
LRTLSKEIINDVLSANDIVEVIGARVELQTAGPGRFKGLCPFHSEKTPSFTVSRDRQMFHCFGCGKSGDAISFLREFDMLGFYDSLRVLADRGGVVLPEPTERDSKEDFERNLLQEIGRFAAKWFRDTLDDPLKGGAARAYLKTRDLKPATLARFGLGFAPDSYDTLLNALLAAGYKEPAAVASGLVRRSERGSHYAFFRNRLMIPIRDVAGNVVAFGGRDLSGAADMAKYINTPENALYKKGRVLYGLHEARDALRREKRAILVEGYFDLMRCFDSGIENVVAPCGTALTGQQAALLRRYVPEVLIVFDGDRAGVSAALRGVAVLTAAGLTVRALLLPGGDDPDDYIRKNGADAFRAMADEALDFVSFYVRMNGERTASIEGRTDIARELFVILSSIDDELRRQEYLKAAARELRLDEWSVRREYEKHLRDDTSSRYLPEPESRDEPALVVKEDCDFVAALIQRDELLAHVREHLAGNGLPGDALGAVVAWLFGHPAQGGAPDFEDTAAGQLYAAAANTETIPLDKARELVAKRVVRIRRETLEREAAQVQEALRAAESRNDSDTAMQLMTRRVMIRREMEKLGAA